jgi:3-oxoacyl-[acyl-carrier protein] reductase
MVEPGRVVVITGAAKGIGAAIARAFARDRARLALLDVDAPGVEAVRAALEAQGVDAQAFPADVTRAAAVQPVVDAVAARWGRVDVLVNNAGGFPEIKPTERIGEEEWDVIFRMNVTSAFLCSRAVLPLMRRQRHGRIVNLSSIVGRGGAVLTASHYAAAKAAVIGFTRHLALEVGVDGITVNAVAPGTTATERFRSLRTAKETARIAERVPLRRVAEPDEIAAAVVFLASEAASYITGATLDVNGGILMA